MPECTDFYTRRIGPHHAEEYRTLRIRALEQEPSAFGEAVEEMSARSLSEIARSLEDRPTNSTTFGVYSEASLIGMGALFSTPERHKLAHRCNLWGMYVAPEHRGQGAGTILLNALLEQARSNPRLRVVTLSVTGGQHEAYRLYTRVGFVEWGRLPEGLCLNGREYDEICMFLHLRRTVTIPTES